MEEVDVTKDFSKWRRRLWPFHQTELKKLLPLILIKFFITVIFCILANLKEAMVVTSEGSGAEVIPVLKGLVVLPAAFIMTLVYSKLSYKLSKKTLFYTVIGGFLAVIFLYTFILYPNIDFFTPTASSDWLSDTLGAKYSHWIAVYRNWIHSLLFITAELWGSVVILLMFWGFANDVTNVSEAKRSYNIYIAAGNLATLSIGSIVWLIIKKMDMFSYSFRVQTLLSLVLIFGAFIMYLYWWVNKNVVDISPHKITQAPKKKKEKLSLLEGFKLIGKSRYLLGIAILVVGYGLCINMVEISWKASLKQAFPEGADYQVFTGMTTSYVGFFGFIISMFLGTNIIRRLGWRFSALITPVAVGVTGMLFFAALVFKDNIHPFTSYLGITPLLLTVSLGAFQNIVSKVAKYSFFDPTKEMAYIPLSENEKVRGKAAIDVVGSRLGKSGSSWIQIFLLYIAGSGSILSISHLLVPIIVIMTISWIYSVSQIGKEFEKKATAPQEPINV
ncbi:MAG: ADP,ATP carrier protein 1 [Chlamydiia bacterium]|nr:ADP,ATP carrier protein 1 [Chlamydiia bacterium]MCH9618342.1 ADP,ATP carrier protein 1 [Chlamydiia bacterium]MCH9624236.1 ADP,ATP carrier protein 1 [Chlamydiia bacterium]